MATSSFIVVDIATGRCRAVSTQEVIRIAVGEALVEHTGALPNLRTTVWFEGAFRAATAQEIADYEMAMDATLQDASAATSRQKDQLASAARRLILTNPTAWNAMTLNQKKSAVLAEADAWRDIRVWIEQNV